MVEEWRLEFSDLRIVKRTRFLFCVHYPLLHFLKYRYLSDKWTGLRCSGVFMTVFPCDDNGTWRTKLNKNDIDVQLGQSGRSLLYEGRKLISSGARIRNGDFLDWRTDFNFLRTDLFLEKFPKNLFFSREWLNRKTNGTIKMCWMVIWRS
jgi:hypothetical protein